MKQFLFNILKREAPFFRERVVLSHPKRFAFRQETFYDIQTGILTSNEHSGFGSSLTSLVGPLLLLNRGKILPTRIETQHGFRNYCESTSNEPLAELFEKYETGNQTRVLSRLDDFVYYPNSTGNFAKKFPNYWSMYCMHILLPKWKLLKSYINSFQTIDLTLENACVCLFAALMV